MPTSSQLTEIRRFITLSERWHRLLN